MSDKWEYKEVPISKIKQLLIKNDVEVQSPDGYVPVEKYVEKGKKKLFKLVIDKREVLCSENHLFETNKGWVTFKNLNIDVHTILCDDNKYHSFIKKETDYIKDVVDIKINHPNHRYYTNGISSHNTNLGKSLLKCAFATNCLLKNKNVLYITLEMSESKVSERIMANLFDIELDDLYTIPKDRFLNTFESVKEKITNKLVIKEYATRSANTNRIRNLLKELELKKRFIPDIIFIDYLGIMLPNRFNKGNNTNTELKTISEEIRGLAMEKAIPIVSSVQTNRGGFSELDLELTDVAESIGTTNTADVIFGVVQSDEMKVAGRYLFILLKNRYGLNRLKSMVGVNYKKMRLYEVNDEDDNDEDINITNGKPETPKGTEYAGIIDEAAVKIIKTKNNNRISNKNKVFNNKDIKM